MPAVTKSRNDEENLNPTAMAVQPEAFVIEKPKIYVPEELPEYTGPIIFPESKEVEHE